MKHDLILRFAVPSPLRRLFDYLPPHDISDEQLQPGTRFSVPFGARQQIAVLIETAKTSDFPAEKIKRANAALDSGPTLPASIVCLGNWMAHYYLHPIGDVFSHLLPVALRSGNLSADRTHTGWQLTQKGRLVSPDTLGARAKKQRHALSTLQAHEHALTVQTLASLEISSAHLKNLQNLGLVEPVEWSVPHEPWQGQSVLAEAPLGLHPEQQQALHAITEKFGEFATFLLFGITGSGKTEVYLQAIERVISNNAQALILVPEIGLTPQTVSRFKQRFRVPIVVIHSGLTDLQRLEAWQAARSGNAAIIIGTR
ncbi:MAG TPA: DEAD/DEAH box helicase family protein, partial [Pseudomonadales bacterium]|nr:DEAD/DEAH box helicase family protein [Pseudomonadales bacterium]